MHRRSFLLAALGILGTSACGRVPPPLVNTSPSAEALATAVLAAIARRDRARLEALAVSEREFRDHVWPDLPAARPERNLPFSYVWGDLRQKSTLSLTRVLDEHGGKRHALHGVAFAGIIPYAHYTVHRDARLAVVDAAGVSQSLRVCGSFLEKDGLWKVFSYAVND
jgi:hypothetical protein